MRNELGVGVIGAVFALGVLVSLGGCGDGKGPPGHDVARDATDVGASHPDSVPAEPRDGAHHVSDICKETTTPSGDVHDDVAEEPPGRPSPFASVDPMIGTGSMGFNVGNAFPGATLPFGMVKLSPDTTGPAGRPWPLHCAGYRYEDSHILGYSHMRLHGTGVPDYGVIRFMPALLPEETEMSAAIPVELTTAAGYRAPLDHTEEEAAPGYYAITQSGYPGDGAIRVELTSTPRAGYHRYTFPDDRAGLVIIDLGEVMVGGRVSEAQVRIDSDDGRVWGSQHNIGQFSGRYGGFTAWFDARFDRPFASYGVWTEEGAQALTEYGEGVPLGVWLWFDGSPSDNVVEAQVGISLVDAAGALGNREAELAEWGFAETRATARDIWSHELERIEIEGTTPDERIIFYTALYHTMMMPTMLTDVDGRFRGVDKSVHEAEDFLYYTDFSMWDTFRTLHPLLTLLMPDRARDMARSLVHMGVVDGAIPRWPMGIGHTNSMIGTAGDCVIADTYVKGVTDFDAEAAYDLLMITAMGRPPEGSGVHGRSDIEDYVADGFLTTAHNESVAKTLEYAFYDFCLARFAEALGKEDDRALFDERARNYRHLWDPETEFMRPRTPSGEFLTPFEPIAFSDHYTEATAWQYSWFVPHDVVGLVDLFGSAEAMVTKLERFFQETVDTFVFELPGSYYYHGNEPSIQAAYMFLEAGRPDLTQKYVRWILATNYRTDPGGIIGNDDGGTLAAWYVMSALGFYPLPGTARYYIGSPIVSRAVLALPTGDVVITADGAGPDNIYVQGVWLNGEPLEQLWFDHDDLMGGATLHFEMGPE